MNPCAACYSGIKTDDANQMLGLSPVGTVNTNTPLHKNCDFVKWIPKRLKMYCSMVCKKCKKNYTGFTNIVQSQHIDKTTTMIDFKKNVANAFIYPANEAYGEHHRDCKWYNYSYAVLNEFIGPFAPGKSLKEICDKTDRFSLYQMILHGDFTTLSARDRAYLETELGPKIMKYRIPPNPCPACESFFFHEQIVEQNINEMYDILFNSDITAEMAAARKIGLFNLYNYITTYSHSPECKFSALPLIRKRALIQKIPATAIDDVIAKNHGNEKSLKIMDSYLHTKRLIELCEHLQKMEYSDGMVDIVDAIIPAASQTGCVACNESARYKLACVGNPSHQLYQVYATRYENSRANLHRNQDNWPKQCNYSPCPLCTRIDPADTLTKIFNTGTEAIADHIALLQKKEHGDASCRFYIAETDASSITRKSCSALFNESVSPDCRYCVDSRDETLKKLRKYFVDHCSISMSEILDQFITMSEMIKMVTAPSEYNILAEMPAVTDMFGDYFISSKHTGCKPLRSIKFAEAEVPFPFHYKIIKDKLADTRNMVATNDCPACRTAYLQEIEFSLITMDFRYLFYMLGIIYKMKDNLSPADSVHAMSCQFHKRSISFRTFRARYNNVYPLYPFHRWETLHKALGKFNVLEHTYDAIFLRKHCSVAHILSDVKNHEKEYDADVYRHIVSLINGLAAPDYISIPALNIIIF